MKWIILVIIVMACVFKCNAQNFEVGLVGHQPNVIKLSGKIIISDSTITTIFNGQQSSQKITNKTDLKIYTTDGTATNSYSISPLAGKLKGFTYDCIITYTPDTRFNTSGSGNFFCRRLN